MAKPDKWTVMFFFAGDNNLSPSMISQLKAIKDAGYQKDTTVLVRFDPNEKGAPTSIFEVNLKRKQKEGNPPTRIGDGSDPFVRNLREDDVTLNHPDAAEKIYDIEQNISEPTQAGDALRSFLNICHRSHPAKHYILFLVGHGMIVGNDAFLPDDHPESAVTLEQLGQILSDFAGEVKSKGEVFELVGMHSCSMSAIEVAYQLRGTARYMMATEGISFVGSWPYRQLLKKVFHTVEKAGDNPLTDDEVKKMLKKLHFLSLHNSTDFMFAGFSADLALCNLNKKKVEDFNTPLAELTRALKATLKVPCGQELILLSHWKSQSYWQENYTDLYDFCRCLSENTDEKHRLCRCSEKCDEDGALQKSIQTACGTVMNQLDPPWDRERAEKLTETENLRESFDKFVVYSSHFGPTYQYSHGLSVYFPWSRPVEDDVNSVIEKYRHYEFTKQLVGGGSRSNDNSWLSFLEEYFAQTKRAPRKIEDHKIRQSTNGKEVAVVRTPPPPQGSLPVAAVSVGSVSSVSSESLPGGPQGKANPALTGKTSPADSGGIGCNCGSIKNYPMEFPPPPEDNDPLYEGANRQGNG